VSDVPASSAGNAGRTIWRARIAAEPRATPGRVRFGVGFSLGTTAPSGVIAARPHQQGIRVSFGISSDEG